MAKWFIPHLQKRQNFSRFKAMCESDKMVKEIVRMPERTQRSGSKCLLGVFAFLLTKMQACPTSRLCLRLCPLLCRTRKFQESKCCQASFPRQESRESGWGSSKTQEPWVVAGLSLGLLLLVV